METKLELIEKSLHEREIRNEIFDYIMTLLDEPFDYIKATSEDYNIRHAEQSLGMKILKKINDLNSGRK